MNRLFLILLASLALLACDNKSNPAEPDDPCVENPELCVNPDPIDPNPIPLPNPVPTPFVGNALLSPTANADYPTVLYQTWKSIYVQYQEEMPVNTLPAAVGTARIIWDTQTKTVSEGIGYGMLNAYFSGDYDLLIKLFNYSQAFKMEGYNLMPWLIYGFTETEDYTIASDADFDIATALILSYYATGIEQYKQWALPIVQDIWTYLIWHPSLMIRPGDAGFKDVYNSSYFAPVAFRLFSTIDPVNDWNGVINTGYAYLQSVQSQGNGLIADWTDPQGTPVVPTNNRNSKTYNRYYLESVRVPWRLAWDYHWFGEPRAKTILDGMATFITAANANEPNNTYSIYPFYPTDDTLSTASNWKTGNKPRIGMMASTCAMGLANPNFAAYVQACTDLLNNTEMKSGGVYFNYFNHILQVMYAQMLNGKYIKPSSLPL